MPHPLPPSRRELTLRGLLVVLLPTAAPGRAAQAPARGGVDRGGGDRTH